MRFGRSTRRARQKDNRRLDESPPAAGGRGYLGHNTGRYMRQGSRPSTASAAKAARGVPGRPELDGRCFDSSTHRPARRGFGSARTDKPQNGGSHETLRDPEIEHRPGQIHRQRIAQCADGPERRATTREPAGSFGMASADWRYQAGRFPCGSRGSPCWATRAPRTTARRRCDVGSSESQLAPL